jgi:hypothetical protein
MNWENVQWLERAPARDIIGLRSAAPRERRSLGSVATFDFADAGDLQVNHSTLLTSARQTLTPI